MDGRRIGLRSFGNRTSNEGLELMRNFNNRIGLRSHHGNASYDGNHSGNMLYVGNHDGKPPYVRIQHENIVRIATGETTNTPCLGT